VILAGATEVEHYEIVVYETLLTNVEARGAPEVVALLRQNLEQEQAALENVNRAARRISHEGYKLAVA
jgi:ferritin-like metal-binding protein YciE